MKTNSYLYSQGQPQCALNILLLLLFALSVMTFLYVSSTQKISPLKQLSKPISSFSGSLAHSLSRKEWDLFE